MSRGRKERTPAQLAVLAQAREKAKIVIAEFAQIQNIIIACDYWGVVTKLFLFFCYYF
jgi:predicted house-cleaning NTP pyrophosphatase (Maf/HAM1 superfamily)